MFRGSMVAMVTPMREDGAVDDDALARLVEFHVDAGTDAIIAVGTTGESATLDHDEHREVVRKVIEAVAGRVPVIAGTGANSTTEALHLTRDAAALGADGCLLVTPYYNKPTQEGLYRHFKLIAESVEVPQVLYNVPGRTACDMQPDTVGRLSRLTNVVSIKEASGDLARVGQILDRAADGFEVVSGEDPIAMETILAGGKGVISVTANIAPAAMHAMCDRALRGDRAGAEAIDARLRALHKNLFIESNPIPSKWLLHDMGLIPPGIRLPLTPLSAEYHEAVRSALREAEGALPAAA